MFYTRLFSVIWTSPGTGRYLSYQTKTQAQARADLYLSTPYVPTWRLLVFGYTSSKLYDVKKVDCVWNVMAQVQKPYFVFRRNGRVHLNRRGRQFSRILADEVCASAVVMLDTPCSEVMWRVLATHSIRQFPLPFPSCASPCAITFQLDSTSCICRCFWRRCIVDLFFTTRNVSEAVSMWAGLVI